MIHEDVRYLQLQPPPSAMRLAGLVIWQTANDAWTGDLTPVAYVAIVERTDRANGEVTSSLEPVLFAVEYEEFVPYRDWDRAGTNCETFLVEPHALTWEDVMVRLTQARALIKHRNEKDAARERARKASANGGVLVPD